MDAAQSGVTNPEMKMQYTKITLHTVNGDVITEIKFDGNEAQITAQITGYALEGKKFSVEQLTY